MASLAAVTARLDNIDNRVQSGVRVRGDLQKGPFSFQKFVTEYADIMEMINEEGSGEYQDAVTSSVSNIRSKKTSSVFVGGVPVPSRLVPEEITGGGLLEGTILLALSLGDFDIIEDIESELPRNHSVPADVRARGVEARRIRTFEETRDLILDTLRLIAVRNLS